MSDVETPIKSTEKKRNYCAICSNFRGKIVNGRTIKLHRFPEDGELRRIWIRRVKNISPTFRFSSYSRLCSDHFVNGEKTTENNVPSIFKLTSGKRKEFALSAINPNVSVNCSDDNQISNIDIATTAISSAVAEEDSEIFEEPANFNSNQDSVQQTSLFLHDYCGQVMSDTVSAKLDKSEQTDMLNDSATQQPVKKILVDAAVQCEIEYKSTLVQTDNESTVITDSKTVGIQTLRPDVAFEDIEGNTDKIMFYTGLPNAGTFKLLFNEMSDAFDHTKRKGAGNTGRPRALRLVDEFFLVLIRLRLGLLLEDLADRFHISKATCSVIVSKWIDYLHVKLSFLVSWPSRTTILNTMPRKFKEKYPMCRVIIDCTELYTETPQSLCNRSLMYSHYKAHMTYKALLGISPSGMITFASDLWAGSISDKQLTSASGILELCERGDSIMADKGFLISDLTTPRGIKLIIPPLKYKRFSRREVEETRRIANLRIDVERAMERVKNFRILQGVIPITLSAHASKTWKICCFLSNLLPPLVQDDE